MESFKEYYESQTKDIINEMSLPKKKFEEIISGLSDPILLQLIKILKWEDIQNYNKHLVDIDGWLRKINRLKMKPKILSLIVIFIIIGYLTILLVITNLQLRS